MFKIMGRGAFDSSSLVREGIMRKIFLLFVVCMFISVGVSAETVEFTKLYDTSGTVIGDYSLTSGAAVTTAGVKVKKNVGFAILLVTEDKSGGAGDVDIYAQYSETLNGTYNRVWISNMLGTITQEGNIVTTLQNVTRRIVFAVRLGGYINIVFDPVADSQVTATLIFQEDEQ